MNNRQSTEKLLDQMEYLFEGYSNELRKTTQPYQLKRVQKSVAGYRYDPDDNLIKETLMEHVGSLPMVATAMYPFIDDPEVDLGRALTMLAIHDIGELVTGDEMTFTKQKTQKGVEMEAGLKLLHPNYHDLYEDVEQQRSKSAKFAKAIDKITPDIFDYLTPADVTIQRFEKFVGIGPEDIMALLLKHKRPYMLWNPFMTDFHVLLYEKIEEKLAKVAKSKLSQ
jgi:5'-deoxynucleotidase YfbR-like HD superfamily hydrolase